jgi:hypothetical protein
MARYKQLLFYANKLEPLPAEDHVSDNKVEGCVSQVGAGSSSMARWLGLGRPFAVALARLRGARAGAAGRKAAALSACYVRSAGCMR